MALTDELRGVYFKYFVENELHYNGTAWYFVHERMILLIHQKYYFVIRETNSCKQWKEWPAAQERLLLPW